jgi:ATP-dependent DNA helicase DinG
MRGELVAIDLETTGLDIQNDSIIEIGAVRMVDGKITAEYSTFVDPEIQIPALITQITGIKQDDVTGAPRIQDVLPQVSEFVRGAPVIAHNIRFDMGMLQERYQILQDIIRIDTYELASVLMPTAERYNLTSLTQAFGIELENAHRALDDARATALLYWGLWEKMLTMPTAIIGQINQAAEGLDWAATHVFKAAYPLTQRQPESKKATIGELTSDTPSLQVSDQPAQPIDLGEIEALFAIDGPIAEHIEHYKPREQQDTMAQAVINAFNLKDHLLIEAGTGTGKSLAYLLPAILWATRNNRRVVISTNTINLQDQLINQDIPKARQILNIPFTSSVLKGRANYLSPMRLQAALKRRAGSIIEMRVLAKILIWQLEDNTGEKSKISLRGPEEHAIWALLSAEDDYCNDEANIIRSPFCRARQQAEKAHILIVNHALLMSDTQSPNSVLPTYDYLIVDEAHQLEEAITHSMTYRIDTTMLQNQLDYLGSTKRGILAEILHVLRDSETDKNTLKVERFIQSLDEATTEMKAHITAYFRNILRFVEDVRSNRSKEYLTIIRIEPSHRARAIFMQIQDRWQTLSEFFDVLTDALKRLTKSLARFMQANRQQEFVRSLDIIISKLTETQTQLREFAIPTSDNIIHWVSIGQNDELPSVNSAPLHVGRILQDILWDQKQAIVMTSATLQTQNSFTFLQDRLSADAIHTLDVGSPFDYKENTLLYLPQDIPEPVDRKGYQQTIERAIIELAAALNGRVLALFTSFNQLRNTAQAITPRLALGNITVYDQSDGTSRENLLDGFKSTEQAVLLGTRSFWEGIDIPGDSLSALVITRLPFVPPSSPVHAARADTYNDSFAEYNLQDAILRFRQGFGRLIRKDTDRGIVVVLDARINSRSYGRAFIDALPECTIKRSSLDELAHTAKNWLDR